MAADDQTFDAVIVGGGPAGCVLASRLSECPDKRILLIEAGPDQKPGEEHPDLLDPYAPTGSSNGAFHWPGLVATTDPEGDDGQPPRRGHYTQGFGIGGGSNINGMGVDRGLPQDYELWESMGADGWGWDAVLPYFRKSERDLDFAGGNAAVLHGDDGPMPVRRIARTDWAPFAKAVGTALERRGLPFLEDYTGDFRDGFGAAPTNGMPDRRVSAAAAYLTAAVRARPNLTILPRALADRLTFDGQRADGVIVRVDGAERRVRGHEVIVTAGAIQSPALLMRSGIGPAAALGELGIESVRDVPGVGRNLLNHPVVTIPTWLRPAARQPAANKSFLQNWARYSSGLPGCGAGDMHLMIFNKCAWHAVGDQVGAAAITVLEAHSAGQVSLTSRDPAVSPHVDSNLLADKRDEDRMIAGTRFVLELFAQRDIAALRGPAFLRNDRIVAGLAKQTPANARKATLIARLLEWRPLRRLMLGSSAIGIAQLLRDEQALRAFVMKLAHAQYHVCGTCRMGGADDPDAVVDGAGRVHGIQALRVADASIFPTVPRGYTHFIVIMAAEKIADRIRQDWSVG